MPFVLVGAVTVHRHKERLHHFVQEHATNVNLWLYCLKFLLGAKLLKNKITQEQNWIAKQNFE